MPSRKGDLTSQSASRQLARVYQRDRGICQICYNPCSRADASREHVIRLSDGGSNKDVNVVLAHVRCNNEKGAKDYNPWSDLIPKAIHGCLHRQRNGMPAVYNGRQTDQWGEVCSMLES